MVLPPPRRNEDQLAPNQWSVALAHGDSRPRADIPLHVMGATCRALLTVCELERVDACWLACVLNSDAFRFGMPTHSDAVTCVVPMSSRIDARIVSAALRKRSARCCIDYRIPVGSGRERSAKRSACLAAVSASCQWHILRCSCSSFTALSVQAAFSSVGRRSRVGGFPKALSDGHPSVCVADGTRIRSSE